MCKTHRIAKELDARLLKQLRGGQQLDVPDHGELEDASYLVEKEGEKFVLKTGKFNPNEVDDNWALADMGIMVRQVTESVPDEYILYEYIDSPILSSGAFWTDENLLRVWKLHSEIAKGIKDREISDEDLAKGVEWVEKKPLEAWIKGITGPVYTEDEARGVREVVENHPTWRSKEGMRWVYRDNNADHYADIGEELAVVDADISIRPKHYMDMRYLAWVILKMPDELLTLDWVKKRVGDLGREPERYTTFLMSLIGILWDMHSNERHKGEFVDKTDKIKEIVDWVVKELGGKNE